MLLPDVQLKAVTLAPNQSLPPRQLRCRDSERARCCARFCAVRSRLGGGVGQDGESGAEALSAGSKVSECE